MSDDELHELLERGIRDAVRLLVEKVNEGTASAADIGKLREFAAEAGIGLRAGPSATPLGDDVLESLGNVDPDMLN